MTAPRHFNPDDHLETDAGRVFTPERNRDAWARSLAELEAALVRAGPQAELFVVMGVQGAGKTAWVRGQGAQLGAHVHFFDAALPAARHREPLLQMARRNRVPATAVWIRVPLEVALARNGARRADHIVPEDAVRAVFAALEPPTLAEGFQAVWEVPHDVPQHLPHDGPPEPLHPPAPTRLPLARD